MSSSISKIYSGELEGIDAHLVEVEVDLQVGLHSFMIVGLADKAVSEARERVSGAIKNSGAKPPNRENRKITVNLAPATIRKSGSHYDVPIAIGYLLATKQMQSFDASSMLFAGELSLHGELRRIRGALNIALLARQCGFTTVVLPKENAHEALCLRDISIIAPETLRELISMLEGTMPVPIISPITKSQPITTIESFDTIRGQLHAKRALAIAAAGHHNIILSGPPGVGKSVLARATAHILPKLHEEHAIEVTQVYSAAGLFPENLITTPPFRSPHHTASLSSIIGGGDGVVRPGEITLAHRGILFMDELPEFQRPILESLREPLESGALELARIRNSLRLPATFILIAAMNPCPCGYYGDAQKECICSQRQIQAYRKKISGPLLDRIDLHVTISRPDTLRLYTSTTSTNEEGMFCDLVIKARTFMHARSRAQQIPHKQNGLCTSDEIRAIAQLSRHAEQFLDSLQGKTISPRSYLRLLKTARTIADMEESDQIKEEHLAEAFSYRFK